MPNGLRYPHEKGSTVFSGCALWIRALSTAPVHIPRLLAPVKALTMAPGCCTPKFEKPLVLPVPESKMLLLSVTSSHGMSCWLPPAPLSSPVTPEFVADPCDQ